VSCTAKKTRSEPLAADGDVGTEEKPLLITQSVQFGCGIVEIKREGKEVTALDAPVASWKIDEDFAAGDETVYRLSGLGPDGVRFTAEMTAMDCNYSGYGYPAQMSEDLVIPTFERLLAADRVGAGHRAGAAGASGTAATGERSGVMTQTKRNKSPKSRPGTRRKPTCCLCNIESDSDSFVRTRDGAAHKSCLDAFRENPNLYKPQNLQLTKDLIEKHLYAIWRQKAGPARDNADKTKKPDQRERCGPTAPLDPDRFDETQ
jgi:hypothetical protein